jgi:hypothetical protein
MAIIFSLLFTAMNTSAQEAVVASGGDASGTGGSVSYTVGQVAYTTTSGTNGSVATGVQQPYEISVPTALDNTEDILLKFTAYPNPASDILKLKTGERDFNNLTYKLFDMNGKLIKAGQLTGPETSVNMQSLAPSVYFIKVIQNDKEIKTFKIIKK